MKQTILNSHTMKQKLDFDSTFEIRFGSSLQLNIMLYDRRELSGQRSCHPAQVCGFKQESPFSLIDGYIFLVL